MHPIFSSPVYVPFGFMYPLSSLGFMLYLLLGFMYPYLGLCTRYFTWDDAPVMLLGTMHPLFYSGLCTRYLYLGLRTLRVYAPVIFARVYAPTIFARVFMPLFYSGSRTLVAIRVGAYTFSFGFTHLLSSPPPIWLTHPLSLLNFYVPATLLLLFWLIHPQLLFMFTSLQPSLDSPPLLFHLGLGTRLLVVGI
jgi:hypothetical protein